MKTEEEPAVNQEFPADIKVKEETTSGSVEETPQEVVTTEESVDVLTTEENSNVAINYSQSASQLVYHNDGTYIEYAYQVTQHTNIHIDILGKVSAVFI